MESRLISLMLSGLLAFLVFMLGIFVGNVMIPPKVITIEKKNADYCSLVGEWVQRYENMLSPYRDLLPYRLEEGNVDINVLDEYEFLLYQYYILYKDSWRRCHMPTPILYLAPKGAVKCGETLDELKKKYNIKVFPILVDKHIRTSQILSKYYGFNNKPLLVVCDRVVPCDEEEIRKVLGTC